MVFYFNETVWLVITLAVAVSVMVVLVMLLIRRMLQKKFGEIEAGMQQIGKNRLEYRLPVTGAEECTSDYRMFTTACRLSSERKVMWIFAPISRIRAYVSVWYFAGEKKRLLVLKVKFYFDVN